MAALLRRRQQGYLDQAFPNRNRLLDTLDQQIPQDARLRVIGVGMITTLQEQRINDQEVGSLLVRTVSAVVSTQLEFEDPVTGRQQLPGRYEWILRFRDSLEAP